MNGARRAGSGRTGALLALPVLAWTALVLVWATPAGADVIRPPAVVSRAVRRSGVAVLVLVSDLDWATAPASLDGYAKASLAIRTAADRQGIADAYLTIGKGARTSSAFGADEVGTVTSDASSARLDQWPRLRRHDASLHQGGRLGGLGSALEASGERWGLVYADPRAVAAGADATGTVPAASEGDATAVALALDAGMRALIVAVPRSQLGAVLDAVGGRCVLVASASTPAGPRHFGVLAASADCGLGGRGLTSGSTHRPRLVTLVDVAPTFLAAMGVRPPAAMTGAPAGPSSGGRVSTLLADDHKATTTDAARLPWIWAIVAVNVLGALVAVRRPDGRARVALAVLAVPLASFLVMLVPWWRWGVVAGLLAGAAMAAALTFLATAIGGDHPRVAVAAMIATTVAVLLIDLLGNGWIEREAPLGNSPLVAARFYGLGNAGLGLLAASSVVTGSWVLARWGRRGLPWVAGGLAAVAAIAVAPMFGAKVGAAVTLVPAFALLVVGTRRRRRLWPALGVGVIAAVAVLGAAALADLRLSPLHRTHLARLVAHRDLVDAVARKASAAVRNTGNPLNLVLVVALASIALARIDWRRHPLQHALAPLVAAAVVGSLFNDSGLVVGASAAAIAWPTLLALGSSDTAAVEAEAVAEPAPRPG